MLFTDTCSKLSSTECAACNCNTQGSVSPMCDQEGKCTCKDKFYGKKCTDRDCEMTTWSAWLTQHGDCRCGYTDTKNRTRSVRIQPTGNGEKCPPLTEEGNCTMEPCDCKRIRPGYYGNRCENRDCVLSDWTVWTNDNCQVWNDGLLCFKDCPGGVPRCQPTRHRSRYVKVSQVGAGKDCLPGRSETSSCGITCVKRCSHAWNNEVCGYWKE